MALVCGGVGVYEAASSGSTSGRDALLLISGRARRGSPRKDAIDGGVPHDEAWRGTHVPGG